MINICVRCGNISFHSWQAYKDHMSLYHEVCITAKPMNVSGRSKSEIVDAVEAEFRVTWYQSGHQNPFIGYGESQW